MTCRCGEVDCLLMECGYPWCRPCQDHHRGAECAVDELGRPLAPCGCTWAETEQPGYYDRPCRHEADYAPSATPGTVTASASAAPAAS